MSGLTIRIYCLDSSGRAVDTQQDFELSSFAGFLPAIGDKILEPGVLQGLDRRKPENRVIWAVVDRIFNPRDLSNYVALVVEERSVEEKYTDFVS